MIFHSSVLLSIFRNDNRALVPLWYASFVRTKPRRCLEFQRLLPSLLFYLFSLHFDRKKTESNNVLLSFFLKQLLSSCLYPSPWHRSLSYNLHTRADVSRCFHKLSCLLPGLCSYSYTLTELELLQIDLFCLLRRQTRVRVCVWFFFFLFGMNLSCQITFGSFPFWSRLKWFSFCRKGNLRNIIFLPWWEWNIDIF